MHNDLFTVFGVTAHGYGLMIALGVMAAVALGYLRAGRRGMDTSAIPNLAILALCFGFAGAKLLYALVNLRQFLQHPLAMLGSEGFVVCGGLALGAFAVLIYCRRRSMDFLVWFDLLAPSISLGQALGRVGCFLAGCCYGRETTRWFGVVFPAGSSAPAGVPLIPTQLISAAGNLILMALLLCLDRRRPARGTIGGVYLALYGVGRFLVELLRADARGAFAGLSTSQWISLLMIALGMILLTRKEKRA